MISIKLNKQLDKEVYNDFKDFKVSGVDFGEKIKTDHPEINEDNYEKYIDEFYKNNEDLLEDNGQELNNYLQENQQKLFAELKNIFGVDFSDREYTGYLSIFNCNPRYIENQTFQVYYKKDLLDKIEAIIHEALHFAFFDYCDQFVESSRSLDKNSGPLWELSEIFNVIVLNLPQFQAILKRPEQLFYPDLKEKLEEARKIWSNSNGDIKAFIVRSLTSNKASNRV